MTQQGACDYQRQMNHQISKLKMRKKCNMLPFGVILLVAFEMARNRFRKITGRQTRQARLC